MIKILYFARLRDTLNCAEEELPLSAHITSVKQLLSVLCERGQPWRDALSDKQVRVAINQEITDFNAEIKKGDEIAFFPPVTGG